MAYMALYRKYRPTCFEDIAGQKAIIQTLKNAVIQERIAHAYLFCGPRGTGKTSIAKIFAKMINCESNSDRPCGKCDNCLAAQQGNHSDIIEMDAASNNGVDEVRELIEKVKYAPLNGKYKVYIIDEVHMMSSGAFNALLKTIEEPPAHVIFIFATTEPHKVLPTIISRCQRYDFSKVSISDMLERVKDVLNSEKIQYEDEALRLICQLADGGMRDALSIVDQVIAYSSDLVSVEAVNSIYGIMTVPEKIEILRMVSEKKASKCMQKVNELTERGIDLKRCTKDLIEILKESVIHDYTKDDSLLDILNHDEIPLAKIGKSSKERLSMIDTLIETYDKYRFASNIQSYFEVCLLNMMVIEENVSRETIIPKETEIADVSNETVEEQTLFEEPEVPQIKKVKDEPKTLDKEFVLSLLVGANKAYRNEDSPKYQTVSHYYLDLNWARFANLLRDSTLVASGENYILVAVRNPAVAYEVNEQDAQGAFVDFTEVLLLKRKKVFAITEEEQRKIIEEFKTRNREGTLPPPAIVQVEDDSLNHVIKLFGKENIEIEE